jgi:hypothetical protein
MGVRSLSNLLQRNTRPQVMCLPHSEASRLKAVEGKVLLIDASAVKYSLADKLRDVEWGSDGWHRDFYLKLAFFYRALQATGLRVVLCCDSGPMPGLEATWARRGEMRLTTEIPMPPTFHIICTQAYADLGLEVLRSIHSADNLLLAYYRHHRGR